jgi:uncharacterized protein YcbX
MVVASLWRYPVKSFRGESLAAADFETGGIPFDRSYVVIDANPMRAGKPLTGRIQKRLLGFGARVQASTVRVRTPLGWEHDADDRRWMDELESAIGAPGSIEWFDRPVHDDSDVLVINAASARELSKEYGKIIDPMRFRPNIILDGPDIRPFEETGWTDGVFQVGSVTLRVTHPCERCVMTTIDPTTLDADPAFLRFVVEKHDARFGVYFSVEQPGTARVGDSWFAQAGSEATA